MSSAPRRLDLVVNVPAPRGSGFRKDIQGLRALAVLVVLAFHAHLPVPGGFVGVDAFFVISGFVITSMLKREWDERGALDLGRFYERRFRRLTPALALVVAATTLGGAVLLSPFGAQQILAKTGLGALALSANFVIAKTTGGYFDAPATTNPLLHTWSLAVEEQFYLVFPLLMGGLWRARARWPRLRTTPLVLFGTGFSLFLALRAWKHPPVGPAGWLLGFYGPLARAWELGAGAVLSLGASRLKRLPRTLATALALVGVLLFVVSLVCMSERTPVPGPWMILPVSATLLLLASGAEETNPVARLLSTEPAVKLGDWSYSLYLWHWPLIVLSSVLWPGRRWVPALAALASVVPAVLSYRWIESPFRARGSLRGKHLALALVVVLVPSAAMSEGLLYAATHIFAPRLSRADGKTAFRGEVAWKDHDYRFGGYQPCADTVLRELFDKSPTHEPRCQQSKADPKVDIALLGDSHAEHIFIGLEEALPATNILYFTINGFPSRADPKFAAAVDYVAKAPSIRTVLVTAFWAGRGVDAPPLKEVLASLTKGGKHVLLTDDVPSFGLDPYACKVHLGPCSRDAAEYFVGLKAIQQSLLAVAGALPNVKLLETARFLCHDKTCNMTFGQDLLYADPTHLNVLGSRFVGRRMVAAYGAWLN